MYIQEYAVYTGISECEEKECKLYGKTRCIKFSEDPDDDCIPNIEVQVLTLVYILLLLLYLQCHIEIFMSVYTNIFFQVFCTQNTVVSHNILCSLNFPHYNYSI